MRLTKIKLTGFKSFVDPTVLELRSNLVGVVGPNGCGKSNIIDAVRWVLGERSAKNLRGESMADVIFNGSSTRKPIGQASVELAFDNSDGGIGGQFVQYAELTVKREVTRDGQSNFYLNGTRCRRRDVQEVFLEAALGEHAIISQGTVSQIIEAKPDDMRKIFEVAAGVAIYKQRRRETENRMRHTRENLDRVEDLRQEQEKLLEKLKRQSEAARKFKDYKAEQDTLDGQLQALKWKNYDQALQTHTEQVRTLATAIEEKLARRASLDAHIEKERVEHEEKTDIFNSIQSRFYDLGNHIARHEQSIQHHAERKAQLEQDLAEILSSMLESNEQLEADQKRLKEYTDRLTSIEPNYQQALAVAEQSMALLEEAEQGMQEWNQHWDAFQNEAQQPQQVAEVEKTRIEQYEKQSREAQVSIERLQHEQSTLYTKGDVQQLEELAAQLETFEELAEQYNQQLEEITGQIQGQREHSKSQREQIDKHRLQQQQLKGRQASLEALQQAALGQSDEMIQAWISDNQLADKPRLAQQMSVQNGWEQAVETVLGDYLEAVCLDELTPFTSNIQSLEAGNITLFEAVAPAASHAQGKPLLSDMCQSKVSLDSLMAGIYAADDLPTAMEWRKSLAPHESIITRDGIWIGKHWLRVFKDQDAKRGVLQREQELAEIQTQLVALDEEILQLETELEDTQQRWNELETQRESVQQQNQENGAKLREISSTLSSEKTRLEHMQRRKERIEQELAEHQQKLEEASGLASQSRIALEEAIEKMAEFSETRDELQDQKEELHQRLKEATNQVKEHEGQLHQLELERQTLQTQTEAVKEGLGRLDKQQAMFVEREKGIKAQLSEDDSPQVQLRAELDELLEQRMHVEDELHEARMNMELLEQQIRKQEKERQTLEGEATDLRERLNAVKLEGQSLQTRRETITEHLSEHGQDIETLVQSLPEEANEEEWSERLVQITARIERLGAINLAAIEEYEQEKERQSYLESQFNDLTEALETLDNAIRKIDKETKERFKETFDQVNERFQQLFPKLFGGGQATLEMIGDDLLEAGVTVMARPPGKRNSSIHLLSGGEKALTAVALVFSIFHLNPAPFCMLDEVDAPLDDANVGRFCRMVQEMSEAVQFVFITHNKLTMEIAKQLSGVTMKEPGVSRLVQVDIDEAVEMAQL